MDWIPNQNQSSSSTELGYFSDKKQRDDAVIVEIV